MRKDTSHNSKGDTHTSSCGILSLSGNFVTRDALQDPFTHLPITQDPELMDYDYCDDFDDDSDKVGRSDLGVDPNTHGDCVASGPPTLQQLPPYSEIDTHTLGKELMPVVGDDSSGTLTDVTGDNVLVPTAVAAVCGSGMKSGEGAPAIVPIPAVPVVTLPQEYQVSE